MIGTYWMRLSEKSTFRHSRIIDGQRQTIRIFSVDDRDLEPVLTSLPDLVSENGCKIIKAEKKIVVARLPVNVRGTTKFVYVKQHNALSFKHRLTSIVCASAAMRSIFGASTLLKRGYATAPPLAAVEYRRWGILLKSLYFCEEIPGAKTVEHFWRDDLSVLKGDSGLLKRRALLRGLARLFSSLHEQGIYHNDLKASNILVLNSERAVTEPIFSLIDLQGLRECLFVSRRRRVKNLAQLNRTLGVHLTQTEKLFFLNAYGRFRCLNGKRKRDVVRLVLTETSRQIMREESRHGADHHSSVQAPPAGKKAALRGLIFL